MRTGLLAAVVLAFGCDDAKRRPEQGASTPQPPTAAASKPSADAQTTPTTDHKHRPEAAKTSPSVATSPAVIDAPGSPATPAAAPAVDADPSKERFGDLAYGMSVASVQALVPGIKASGARRAHVVDGGVISGYQQAWVDDASGVSTTMTSETKTSRQSLSGIVLQAPSTVKTRAGVGIGSSTESLTKAYGQLFDGETPGELVALEGWLTFTIVEDKVTKISFAEPNLEG